jgi:glycosyltransferase involved in cell wall biosynthesis
MADQRRAMAQHAPLPLSIFIIAFNEADRIGRTLAAVAGLSDDVVVVDAGSSDGTREVAETHGARVIVNAWPGYGPQKRFAEDRCRHPFVLNLDADEVATPALVAELRALFAAGEPRLPAFRLKIVTVYPGAERPRLFADHNDPVRLYDRRLMRYSPSLTDDRVMTGAHPIGRLDAPALHFSFRSIAHIASKIAGYADLQSIEKARRRPLWLLRLRYRLLEFPLQFLKFYFLKRHVTGGLMGLRYAAALASAKRVRIGRFIEARAERSADMAPAGRTDPPATT